MDLGHILIGVNGLLLASLAFFVRQLVDKIRETADKLASIDKSIAIVANEIKHLETKVIQFDRFEEKMESEVIRIRERLHSLGNDVNGIQMKCKLKHED